MQTSNADSWDKKAWSDLLAGGKAAWDRFVVQHAAIIFAAVRRKLVQAGYLEDAEDVVQDVFLKLCARDRAVLRSYDPQKAKLSTFLTVVAASVTIDHLRRRRMRSVSLEAAPPEELSQDPVEPSWLTIPEGLLSARQALVLELLYKRDLDPAEAAEILGVDPQTVRSMHHKALTKLRAHFAEEEADTDKAGNNPQARG